MRKTGSWGAVAALSIALVIACTAEKPGSPAKRPRVLIGELRVPDAAPGTAIVKQVPDHSDGAPGSNPPGTVEVFGPALVFTTSAGACGGADAVYSPVAVKNYANETLGNVQIVFEALSGTENGLCNTFAGDPLGATSFGRVAYGELAGSASTVFVPGVITTIDPGGVSTVTWWFRYPTGSTTFSFRATVWADVDPAPPGTLSPNDAATRLCRNTLDCGSNLNTPVLTWSGATESAYLQVSASPTFATTVETAVVPGTPVDGGYSFSHTIAAPGPGGARYWRAFNRWTDDGGATWRIGAFSSATAEFEMEPDPYDLWNDFVGTATFRHHASSVAPKVEFWQWGWNVYLDLWHVIRADAHSYYTGLSDVEGPDFWIENAFHGTGEFMNFDISPEHPVSWGACNQWGSIGDGTRLGACVQGPDFTGQ